MHMRISIRSSLAAILLAAAASGCGSATGDEPTESIATTTAELSINPTAATTYAYFRSNVTGWGADSSSAMQKVGGGLWKKTLHVSETWMLTYGLPANVTLTNQQNGWGTKNATLTDPAHQSTPYRQLGTVASLSEGSTALRIAPPALGDYEVTFNAASLTYVVAQPAATKSFSIYVAVDDDIVADPRFNGDVGAVGQAVSALFSATNAVFNDDGRFVKQFAYTPDIAHMEIFTGDPSTMQYVQPPPGYDLQVSLTNRTNWPQYYTAISGRGILVTHDGVDDVLGRPGALSLAHEFGHSRGMYDLCETDLGEPGENPITGQRFDPGPSVMNYPTLSDGVWDAASVGVINRFMDATEINYGAFGESIPRMVVRVVDGGGARVAGAAVAIYPKTLGPDVLQPTPRLSGVVTNGSGEYVIPGDPYNPNLLPGTTDYDAWNLLVEASAQVGGKTRWGYSFMPLMSVQAAYFAGQDYVLTIPLSVVRGDVNGNGSIDANDATLIGNYATGLGWPDPFFRAAGDANCNGVVDIVDSLLVAQLAQGIIAQLPCP
jgi:hypothetical protein